MSIDVFLAVDLISFVAATTILAFGAYRAILFRRAFSDPVFRSRALWTAAALTAWIVPNDTQILFTDLPFPSSGIPAFLAAITLVLAIWLIIVSAMFLDRNVRAAKELDFFHRDTLGWTRFRLVVLLGAPISLVANLFTNLVLENSDLANLTILLLTGTLAYGVLALLLSGLRVHNKYVRRYLVYVGLGFGMLLVTVPLTVPILYDVFLVLGCTFLYLSAVSLYHLRDIVPQITSGT